MKTKTILEILCIALIGYPIWYFGSHVSDPTFRDSAVGNWFGTVVGVIVGLPIALFLTNIQLQSQQRAENQKRANDREENMSHALRLLHGEIVYNEEAISRLLQVLSKVNCARQDVWNWANQVAQSLEIDAYRRFKYIELTSCERAIYSPVDLAYRECQRLTSRVREAHAAHAFFYGYSSDEKSANWQLGELTQFAQVVNRYFKDAKAAIHLENTAVA